jgi:hypothetical protein
VLELVCPFFNPFRFALELNPFIVLLAQGEKMELTKTTGIGSAAAAIQASAGNVAAGGAFATLQSAAMGGYGGAVVGGLVRAGAVVMGGLGWLTGLRVAGQEKAGVVVAEVEADRGEEREDSEGIRGEAEGDGENGDQKSEALMIL